MEKNWGGQNSPLVEEKLWSPYSQSQPHAVRGWKWPRYFLKDFVKCCLRSKALRCTHCWRKKARAGWEAADGEVALNHPQDWCHLMPAPRGLFCHSKASGLQCAVCNLLSYFFNLLLWPLLYPQAMASGGGGGQEKSEIFDKEPLCCYTWWLCTCTHAHKPGLRILLKCHLDLSIQLLKLIWMSNSPLMPLY